MANITAKGPKIEGINWSSQKDSFRFDFRDAVMPVLRQERRFEFRNVHNFDD